ncbi:MAG: 3-oxoacyl-ACP reductase [Candidatus Meridianibacter frigidus]|nr:MAG: 3-oxoacyl-ACP reductase [Candidatus Eremiobacteraeota bacterium]
MNVRARNGTLEGKTALITGASRGIGAAIARDLSAHGAYVVVNYRTSQAQAQDVVDEVQAAGGGAEGRQCDVSKMASAQDLFAQLSQSGHGVDILVNNAGIARDRSFRKMADDQWNDVLQTNLNGAMYCTRFAVENMAPRGYGRVINIASIVGQIGAFGQTNYAAAKGALVSFTKALALEVARYGITVNAICPGYIGTGMWDAIPADVRAEIVENIPMRRVGEPQEVASCVRYLVTEGTYITGQAINVNGGLYRGG